MPIAQELRKAMSELTGGEWVPHSPRVDSTYSIYDKPEGGTIYCEDTPVNKVTSLLTVITAGEEREPKQHDLVNPEMVDLTEDRLKLRDCTGEMIEIFRCGDGLQVKKLKPARAEAAVAV